MNSLRWRVTLSLIAFTLVGLFSLMVISYSMLSLSLQNEIDRTLSERANHVIDALAITPSLPIQGVTWGTTDEFTEPGVFLQILNAEGDILARSFNLGTTTLPVPPANDMKLLSDSYRTVQIDRQSVRVYYRHIVRNGETEGVVEVGQSLVGLESTLNQLRLIYAVGAGAVLVFGLLTGWLITHFALKPIRQLTNTARDIVHAEDLVRRVPEARTNDEIAVLTDTFNHMLDRLQSLFEGQRLFLAEIAHELRTPLSSMLGNVDLMARYGEDATKRKETLTALQRTGRHVTRLLDDLLLLPQSQAGWHLQMRPVFFDDILIETFEAAAEGKLQLQRCERTFVLGDTDRLRQVLTNLIDNALKYSSLGSDITLDLWSEDQRIWMQVSNTGTTISSNDLMRIYEPYFRLTEHNRRPGTGLGLAIVRWIVQEHGGEISFESSPEKGTAVKFWLPEYHPTSSLS